MQVLIYFFLVLCFFWWLFLSSCFFGGSVSDCAFLFLLKSTFSVLHGTILLYIIYYTWYIIYVLKWWFTRKKWWFLLANCNSLPEGKPFQTGRPRGQRGARRDDDYDHRPSPEAQADPGRQGTAVGVMSLRTWTWSICSVPFEAPTVFWPETLDIKDPDRCSVQEGEEWRWGRWRGEKRKETKGPRLHPGPWERSHSTGKKQKRQVETLLAKPRTDMFSKSGSSGGFLWYWNSQNSSKSSFTGQSSSQFTPKLLENISSI